jgi:hypothetical protein
MTTPDYKSIALRLYGYGKFAEDYGYREEYWSQLRAIGAELGVADIENPEDLGIPWPPTLAVQCERPASCKLLTHDHPATDRAMTQDYNGLPDGLPFEQAVRSFDRPYMLSWHERQQHYATVSPPWWKFWVKPETLQERRWVLQSRSVSQDLADYLQGGESRVVELVNSLCTDKATGIYGVQLESGLTFTRATGTLASLTQ